MGRGATKNKSYNDYWQAGRSVADIDAILAAAEIVAHFEQVLIGANAKSAG